MKAPAPRVLMAGTALEGRGGMAAVISVLRRHRLFQWESAPCVATYRAATPHARFLRKSIFHLHGGLRAFETDEAGTRLRRPIRHTLEASSLVITSSDGWAQWWRGAALAPHARVTIEQHYSTEVVCGQLSAIYHDLAGTQG